MTLKTYIEKLQALAKDHPEALEYEVVTSADDEGNYFNGIVFSPTIGDYDGDGFHDEEWFDDEPSDFEPNAVCVN